MLSRFHAGEPAGVHVVSDAVDLGAPTGVVAEPFRTDANGERGLVLWDSGVGRFEVGQQLGVLVDQIRDAPEDLGLLAARQVLPDAGFRRRFRPCDGVVDGFGAAVGEFGELFLGDGIDDGDRVSGARSVADFVQHILHGHGVAPRVSAVFSSATDSVRAIHRRR